MQPYIATPDYYNDYISHYGVLGMKWGIRKNPKKAFEKAVGKHYKVWDKATNSFTKDLKKSLKRGRQTPKASRRTNRLVNKAVKFDNSVRKLFKDTEYSKYHNLNDYYAKINPSNINITKNKRKRPKFIT